MTGLGGRAQQAPMLKQTSSTNPAHIFMLANGISRFSCDDSLLIET